MVVIALNVTVDTVKTKCHPITVDVKEKKRHFTLAHPAGYAVTFRVRVRLGLEITECLRSLFGIFSCNFIEFGGRVTDSWRNAIT